MTIRIGYVGAADVGDALVPLLPDDVAFERLNVTAALAQAEAAELDFLVVAAVRGTWRTLAESLAPLQTYGLANPFPVFVLVPREEPQAMLRAFEMRCADCAWLPVEPMEVRARLHALVQRRRVAMARAAAAEKVWRVATVDAVTGLFNRFQLERALPKAIETAQGSGTALSVLMADIDGMKQYNDLRGHPAGDGALRDVADAIKKSVRPVDQVSRYGGDEMAVILPGLTMVEAQAVAARMVHAVEDLALGLDGAKTRRAPLTLSVGVATLMGSDCRARSLLARADEALYAAKRQGRNRAVAA
jgi:two-component system cell cycle response regulator